MTRNPSDHRDGELVWTPCGTCWGQRTLFTPTRDHGLVASACPTCMGVGERLAGGEHVPAPAQRVGRPSPRPGPWGASRGRG